MGALRNPAAWQTMIAEILRSPALQLLAGLLELVVGALLCFGLRFMAIRRGWRLPVARGADQP